MGSALQGTVIEKTRINVGTYTQAWSGQDYPERVYVEIELRKIQGEHTTITHEPIIDPLELAVTYETRTSFGCGVKEALDPKLFQSLIIEPDDLAWIREVSERWHLNTLRGGCVHQVRGAHIDRRGVSTYKGGWYRGVYWTRMVKRQTKRCPVGYRYGSAWLVEPLPDEVVFGIKTFIAKYAR